jgi:hypothetical protein
MKRLRTIGWALLVIALAVLCFVGIQLYSIYNLHNFSLGHFSIISQRLAFVGLILVTIGTLLIRIKKEPETKQTPS